MRMIVPSLVVSLALAAPFPAHAQGPHVGTDAKTSADALVVPTIQT